MALPRTDRLRQISQVEYHFLLPTQPPASRLTASQGVSADARLTGSQADPPGTLTMRHPRPSLSAMCTKVDGTGYRPLRSERTGRRG